MVVVGCISPFEREVFTLDVSGGLMNAEARDFLCKRLVMCRSSTSLLLDVLSGKCALDLIRSEGSFIVDKSRKC